MMIRPRLRPRLAVPALAAVVLLVGCEPPPVDVRQAYPIKVQPETVSLTANYAGGRPPFAPEQFNALVGGYLQRGHGPITISAAPATPGEAHVGEMRERLIAAGVPASAIAEAPAGQATASTITLSYLRYNVVVPVCGDYSQNLSIDFYNVPPPNFGCAVQRDIGLMVADPGDLVSAHAMTSTDAQNSERVLSLYRTGQPPAATETPLQTSGAVGIAAVGH